MKYIYFSTAALLITSTLSAVDFNILMEERVDSQKVSQTVLKFQAGQAITDDLYFFSGLWLRDKLPIIYQDNGGGNFEAGNSHYVNFIDLYAGLQYSLTSWLAPYFFYEEYYDHTSDTFGGFSAFGFGGTVYDNSNHNVSYFSEIYFADNSNASADSFGVFGSESAVKYKYSIYDKNAALYVQAVWNTDATYTEQSNLLDGYYSTRFGIQLNF